MHAVFSALLTRMLLGIVLVVLAYAILSAIVPAHAANFQWDGGGGDTSWLTAGNWTGAAPSSNDQNDFQFGAVALQSPFNATASNPTAGFKVNSIGFFDTSGVSFNIGGSQIELAKDSSTQPTIEQHSSISQTISAALKNSGNSYSFTGDGTGLVTISGNVETGGKDLTKTGTSSFRLTGTLDGGNVILSGGTLAVNNDATNIAGRNIQFTGGVLAMSGSFTRGLGSSGTQVRWGTGGGGFAAFGGALTVNIGGAMATQTWGASNFVPAASPLIFGSVIADNTVTFQNGINLGSTSPNMRVIQVNDNANTIADFARITGQITETSGTQSLNKTGAGTLELANTVNNAYAGTTTVSAGTLRMTHAGALGTTAAGTSVTSGAALHLTGNLAVGAEALTLNGTGNSATGAMRSIMGSSTWAGAVNLATNSSIGVDADSLTISGVLSGMGLTKVGAGTLILSVTTHTYTGATTVSQGSLVVDSIVSSTSQVTVETAASLVVDGSISSTGPVNVQNGATLEGSGIINAPLTVSGTLAPGSSPGTLTVSNDLVLNPASVLAFELSGAQPNVVGGGVNDLILVTGLGSDLTLDDPTLNVTETVIGSFLAAQAGDKWRLIEYSGALTSGATVALGSMPQLSPNLEFMIDTLTAGQINLVVTAVPEASAIAALGLVATLSGATVWLRKRRANADDLKREVS